MLTQSRIKPIMETPAGTACQSCGSTELDVFYQTTSIPVNSCLLLNDEDSARNYPKGELLLAFCRSCGFIGNIRFNPDMARYTNAYEEQQSFSPRFNAFAEQLAKGVIERHGIRNKTVLEIGCGKGDFLMLLCNLGPNKGIGIDPSYIPERQNHDPEQVQFIADFYSEKYTHLKADLVCCRHTLEHISNTYEFMRMVRSAIGDAPQTLVWFELPDVMRVLKEAAFWDIYYEHCSYFTLGSLARLFRKAGFEVLDLAAEYDNQYLLIEARPSNAPGGPHLAAENDLEEVYAAVAQFQETNSANIARWKETIQRARANGRKIALWGSGSKCVSFLSNAGVKDDVAAIVDINPHRHGRYLPGSGRRIDSPARLQEIRPDLVIAMNPIYLDEIGRDLAGIGLHPELTAV